VLVQLLISYTGKVIESKIIKEDKGITTDYGFGSAAIQAIKRVTWLPTLKDDKPVSAWVALPVE